MSEEIKCPAPLSDIASLRPLGSLELQIMQVIWRREEAGEKTTTVGHVFEVIYGPQCKTAYVTYNTIANRLRNKGWLKKVKKVDRTFHYRSTVSRQEVGQEILRWTVLEFFDGDPPSSALG